MWLLQQWISRHLDQQITREDNVTLDSIQNYIHCSNIKIPFSWNTISHTLHAFEVVSQQLDDQPYWNSLCNKVHGSYYDFFLFCRNAGCAGFFSAGHKINNNKSLAASFYGRSVYLTQGEKKNEPHYGGRKCLMKVVSHTHSEGSTGMNYVGCCRVLTQNKELNV